MRGCRVPGVPRVDNVTPTRWLPVRTARRRRESVAEAAADWLALYATTARNAKGRTLAAARVRLYLVPALGGRPLAALTGDNVRAYRMWLERSGLAANTVLHVLSDLRALLAWAVAEGRLARSPFPRRVLPRISELPPRGFTESDRFDLVLIDEPWGFVLRLLIGTGMRWSEACRARREHVQNGALVIAETKSGRVRRVPLMGDLLYEVLAREGRLVPYATGSPGSFSRTVRSKCGVKDFHVHRCRHTFAMRWLAAGGSLPVLQELLGHRDLSTTMRYAKVSEELVRREAERVAKRLDRDEF